MARPSSDTLQTADADWMTFPGGELEGKRPRALCPACREQLSREQLNSAAAPAVRPAPKPICFQCYRAELERDRALKAAGQLDRLNVRPRHKRASAFPPGQPKKRTTPAR